MSMMLHQQVMSDHQEKDIPKLKILVAEDHAPTRLLMTRLLRQAGAEVIRLCLKTVV